MTESADNQASEAFSFDFNDPKLTPVDDRVGTKANYYLRRAIDITAREATTPRERALAALEAARLVLDEFAPAVTAPLAALENELRDLDAGGVNGPITRRRQKLNGGRPPLSEEELRKRARVVFALQWLQRIGVSTRKKAATIIADAIGGKLKDQRKVAQLQDDFTKGDAQRERQALKDLWFELEVESNIDIDGATSDDVIAWLKA